ncbi:hypothetical protein WMF37_02050 [Sorangium sp. So ce291]|uniref:hypothetical protein n=1 Tax=Sorangium sp. So ce291 TaxID=3133294 RepID=UPI003F5E9CDE
MSEHERLVPWREMVPGQVYRAPSAWTSSQPGASAALALASAVVDAITGSTDTA